MRPCRARPAPPSRRGRRRRFWRAPPPQRPRPRSWRRSGAGRRDGRCSRAATRRGRRTMKRVPSYPVSHVHTMARVPWAVHMHEPCTCPRAPATARRRGPARMPSVPARTTHVHRHRKRPTPGSALAHRLMCETDSFDRATGIASFDGEEHKEHRRVLCDGCARAAAAGNRCAEVLRATHAVGCPPLRAERPRRIVASMCW